MRRDEIVNELVMNIHHKYIKNEDKGDWRDIEITKLFEMFNAEIKEFHEAIQENDLNNAIKEVADIALFGAYMVDKLKSGDI